MSFTNYPNGVDTTIVRDGVEKTAAYTVVVNTDSGKTFYAQSANDVTFTLPAIADGEVYTFVNMNPDGTTKLSVSPAAADGINYIGANDDNKDLINTAATAKKGDYVKIASVAGATTAGAWDVIDISGVWAKEA